MITPTVGRRALTGCVPHTIHELWQEMSIWEPVEVPLETTLHWQVGPLKLWARRAEQEWMLGFHRGPEDEASVAMRGPQEKPEDVEWSHWAAVEGEPMLRLVPVMPDRPVVVRPESPLNFPPETEAINYTRFPIRRHNIELNVALKEDIGRVTEVLAEIAKANPYCLDEPEPLILVTGFGESSIQILFGVWFAKDDFLTVRKTMMRSLKERFDAEGIELALPRRALYAGSQTAPFPVQVVDAGPPPDPSGS